MRASLQLKGLADYLDALQRAGEDINQVSREALGEVGPILQSEMRRDVPYDEGDLHDTIQIHTPSGEGDYNYILVGIIHDAAYTTRENAIKARVFEFGSKSIAARPFIRPAIARNKRLVNDLIYKRLKAKGLVD